MSENTVKITKTFEIDKGGDCEKCKSRFFIGHQHSSNEIGMSGLSYLNSSICLAFEENILAFKQCQQCNAFLKAEAQPEKTCTLEKKQKFSIMGDGRLIIAIDFDNTIVEPLYPEIGVLKANCKRIINKWYNLGHAIIINTCRAGKFHGDCEKFLIQNGISFNFINCNMPELINFYKADTRKISADVYIDDRNLGGLPDWLEIEKIMDSLFAEYLEVQ